MRFAPSLLVIGVMPALPQQERRYLLAFCAKVDHRSATRPREIAHRLMVPVRYPYRGELAGAQQLCQALGITPVGLHSIARLSRNQRRRNHHASMPEPRNLPMQSVSGRTCFVTEHRSIVFSRQLAHELGCGGWGVLDLTEKSNLTRSASVRNRYRVTQFRTSEGHESFAIIHHDSPSLLEALPGQSGQPSQSH